MLGHTQCTIVSGILDLVLVVVLATESRVVDHVTI